MCEISYESPLYIQLREVIRSKIEEEEYLPGTAIPSENQLMETYGLNRVSVRSALAALEFEGLLKSVKGKGAFVAGPKAKRNMDTLAVFTTPCARAAETPPHGFSARCCVRQAPIMPACWRFPPRAPSGLFAG